MIYFIIAFLIFICGIVTGYQTKQDVMKERIFKEYFQEYEHRLKVLEIENNVLIKVLKGEVTSDEQ